MNVQYVYDGSAGATKRLDFGGDVVLDANASFAANTSLVLFTSPWTLFGARYAAGVAVPYVWVDVEGFVQPGRFVKAARKLKDSAQGIGDITMVPLMLAWREGDLKWGANFSVYAPTGDFQAGRLANLGRNYWTYEPSANISYLSTTNGIEATAFAGFDVNTENDATDYQSGTQFHLDATIAQHLPLFGGIAGIGATGYIYQQVTGDSGSGAVLGSFKARSVAIGPTASYAYKLGAVDLVAEAKWLPEIDVDNRLEGDGIFIKLGASARF
jgi:hypothetical protein